MKTNNRSTVAAHSVAAFGVSAPSRGARHFPSGRPQAPADRAPTTTTEPSRETNRITSTRRRADGVAARPWRSGLLLCLTAAALLLGEARAVDLDPVMRGKWPPFRRGPSQGVAISGNYAYVADGVAGLRVIDVTNPADPQPVGGCDTGGSAYGVAISGHYAYVADLGAGLQVIDVSNPANPQRVGGNSSFDGGAVFVGSHYVFVAARRDGLVILHPFTPLSGPPLSFGLVQAGPTGMDLVLEGLPELRVDLERSSDLHHWQSWTNTLLSTGPVELTDPQVNPRQFYRAIAR